MELVIDLMKEIDLDLVIEIQRESYSKELLESRESFSLKLQQSPDTCFILKDAKDIIGYFFSVPCLKDRLPFFDDREFMVSSKADCLYLHDLAIRRRWRGQGVPLMLFNKLLEISREKRIKCFRIISVQNTYQKWASYGFKEVQDLSKELRDKLRSFPTEAYIMEMLID